MSYGTKLFLKKLLRIVGIIAAVLLAAAIAVLLYLEPYVRYDRDGAHLDLSGTPAATTPPAQNEPRPTVDNPQIIYNNAVSNADSIAEMGGYYITTDMLRQPDKVMDALREIETPCAVAMELKSIFGNFYYSTSIAGAPKADADIEAVDRMISYLKDKGCYMTAVIPAFCDTAFALENQSSGLPISGGALWMDSRGCYWMDPASETALSYLMQIARELSGLGFQEVVFSEFLFPDSVNISYSSELSSRQIIAAAAQELTTFFKGSNLMISFRTEDSDFPAEVCEGRLYIPNVDGSKVEKYVKAFREAEGLQELVFIASSRDTRFEDQAVIRPLLTE